MNSTTQKTINGAKLLTIGFALFAMLRLADYTFYGHKTSDLLSSISFALMGYGFFKNGGRGKPSAPGESFDHIAHWGMIIGLVLGLGTLAAKYIA
ncbi:hypothetical protein [Thermomonas brevis]|jgi:hypothetical protein